jgi:site-specific DNA-methyltransferase (adenine-specific)
MHTQKTQKVFHGNNIELLKSYPDNSIDSIVTDPPYGLGKEPNPTEMLEAWLKYGYMEVKGGGFMNAEWDSFVPQPIFWKEAFRVLKHGGYVVSFFGTRTYDWGVMAMRLAGFEIRDQLQWIYGSGFPKSMDIEKQIDKIEGNERKIVGVSPNQHDFTNNTASMMNKSNQKNPKRQSLALPITEGNSEWEGWGTALKPANEPIVLARKPNEKGLNITENVLKHGTGGININASRVPTSETITNHSRSKTSSVSKGVYSSSSEQETHQTSGQKEGRFPSNVIFTHHNKCLETLIRKEDNTIESNYTCHECCPVKVLDEQSGTLVSGTMTNNHKSTTDSSPNGIYGKFGTDAKISEYEGSVGGASRFFYVAKASQVERNFGLDNFEKQSAGSLNFRNPSASGRSEDAESVEKMGGLTQARSNFHPTVKPVKLMQYLVRLVTPPNGVCLDPFSGSGTTGVACKIDGFNYIGMEQGAEFCEISQKRIDTFVEEKVFIDECKIFSSKKDEDLNQMSIFDIIEDGL